jgi:hypothetical protein
VFNASTGNLSRFIDRRQIRPVPLVYDASQVRVGARNRTVRLTGAVRSREARDAAERDAWYVFGVDDVINELDVV